VPTFLFIIFIEMTINFGGLDSSKKDEFSVGKAIFEG
jgi:hypothetical protein